MREAALLNVIKLLHYIILINFQNENVYGKKHEERAKNYADEQK